MSLLSQVPLLGALIWASFSVLAASSVAQPVRPGTDPSKGAARPSYEEWKKACQKLPANRSLRGRLPPKELFPLPEFAEFGSLLDEFFTQSKTGLMSQTNLWVGETPRRTGFFNTQTGYFLKRDRASLGPIPFEPFALKVQVPSGSEVYLHADFHGDVRSLMANVQRLNELGHLNGFSIARTNFYMVLLGDYTDRGSYGIEVLYTLFRLKTANPDRVFLARGNHEEMSLQFGYGFVEEARGKYGQTFDAQKVLRAYDFLPVVIYLGSSGNFVQCNHGGVEPGFQPNGLLASTEAFGFQFLGPLKQKKFLQDHPKWFNSADASTRELVERSMQDFTPLDPINPSVLGFMWNDYAVFSEDPEFAIDPGRAFVYGQRATQYLLRQAKGGTNELRAVFRGHQQSSASNPMMRRLVAGKGIFRHWQKEDGIALAAASIGELAGKIETGSTRSIPVGSVWTLNVSPDSIYGQNNGYNFDAFGLLKTATDFSAWQLQVVNVEIPQ